mmetsp:Transcript_11344/g.28754  ORF Transcript_11344/g.28754 Transcript_11344/m.28754 type:complete len:82 (+) Transcript_11344:557-802(+)
MYPGMYVSPKEGDNAVAAAAIAMPMRARTVSFMALLFNILLLVVPLLVVVVAVVVVSFVFASSSFVGTRQVRYSSTGSGEL